MPDIENSTTREVSVIKKRPVTGHHRRTFPPPKAEPVRRTTSSGKNFPAGVCYRFIIFP